MCILCVLRARAPPIHLNLTERSLDVRRVDVVFNRGCREEEGGMRENRLISLPSFSGAVGESVQSAT